MYIVIYIFLKSFRYLSGFLKIEKNAVVWPNRLLGRSSESFQPFHSHHKKEFLHKTDWLIEGSEGRVVKIARKNQSG